MSGAGTHNDARIIARVGASGAGKSADVKLNLLKPKPAQLFVWDYMREYGDFGTSYQSPAAMLKGIANKPQFAAILQPVDEKEGLADAKKMAAYFDLFCRAAYRHAGSTLHVEELAFVTQPSWAPAAWKGICATGRHRGMTVIGSTQRPAMIDKTFFGLATLVRCGRLMYEEDVKTMAKTLRVSPDAIDSMPDLAYIDRDMQTKQVAVGYVELPAAWVRTKFELRQKLALARAWVAEYSSLSTAPAAPKTTKKRA